MMTFLVAAEEAAHSGGINPWLVGGMVLAFLLLLLMALLVFGKGREHT